MPIEPSLSIIVVSYNTREITLACIRSVYEQTNAPFELIVVDNASSDGSAAAIRTEFPEATLLAEGKNHGFAAANNLAALRARGNLLLLLNPDTIVLNNAVDRLVAFSREVPSSKIWGGKTLNADLSLNPTSCWRRMSLWSLFCGATGLSKLLPNSGLFNPEAYGGWQRDTVRQVDIVTGCFLLISKKDWDELGGFDERFFMYGEEADLCLRAKEALDAAPHVTPFAQIIHLDGASERVKADKIIRLLAAKNELIRKHFSRWQKPSALLLLRAWPLSRSLGLRVFRPGSTEAREWHEVWKRRTEWELGFSGKNRTA